MMMSLSKTLFYYFYIQEGKKVNLNNPNPYSIYSELTIFRATFDSFNECLTKSLRVSNKIKFYVIEFYIILSTKFNSLRFVVFLIMCDY